MNEQHQIEFTQFLFPNGNRKQVQMSVDKESFDKYKKLKKLGFSFEIENNKGSVWMSCINYDTDMVVNTIVPNGPEVPIAVRKVIEVAFARFQYSEGNEWIH